MVSANRLARVPVLTKSTGGLTIEPRHEASILSVTGAARLLGVHPNTVRAWTEQGRLRCLRINDRGDRRYRVADLHAFLAQADGVATGVVEMTASGHAAPTTQPT